MAIINVKKESLIDLKINSSPDKDKPENSKKQETEKKQGTNFLSTTIAELKKVNWPSAGYVFRWSLVVIVFTLIMSIALGTMDHLFTNSLKFIDCTSPQGRSQPVNECFTEFINNLTFK